MLLAFGYTTISAQDNTVELDVYGLTCSLCSRHVEQSLRKLDFVQDVEVDLENALFKVSFNNHALEPYMIFRAVKNAGFTLGSLTLTHSLALEKEICLSKPKKPSAEKVVIKSYVKNKNAGEEYKHCKYIYEVVDNS